MHKLLINVCLLFNFLVLIGGAINYIYVIAPLKDDMEAKFDESTASLASKSSEIINLYSEQEKIESVEKIIFLYNKVVNYLDPLEKFMFESSEALLHYSYVIIIISIINIFLIFISLKYCEEKRI